VGQDSGKEQSGVRKRKEVMSENPTSEKLFCLPPPYASILTRVPSRASVADRVQRGPPEVEADEDVGAVERIEISRADGLSLALLGYRSIRAFRRVFSKRAVRWKANL